MYLFLDVNRRRRHNEIAPVLLILPSPYELRVQVAIATFVSHVYRIERLLLQHALVLGRGNVLARRFIVDEGFNHLGGSTLGFSRHESESSVRSRVRRDSSETSSLRTRDGVLPSSVLPRPE